MPTSSVLYVQNKSVHLYDTNIVLQLFTMSHDVLRQAVPNDKDVHKIVAIKYFNQLVKMSVKRLTVERQVLCQTDKQ